MVVYLANFLAVATTSLLARAVANNDIPAARRHVGVGWKRRQTGLMLRGQRRRSEQPQHLDQQAQKPAAKPEKPTSEECGVYSGHYNFAEETQMATTGESMVLMWLVSVLLGCAIGTKYTNHKFLRNLMARLGLRHKPTRESRLPPAHEVRERKEHKHRYLVENNYAYKNT